MPLKKILLKIKQKLNPKGFSMIISGPCKGLYFSNMISDTRYVLGVYEPEIAAKIETYIKSGYAYIDVGANVGYYAMLASKTIVKNNQTIIAIEPFDANIQMIHNHLSKNEIKNVTVIQNAISNSEKIVEFSLTDNHAANTYISDSEFYKTAPKTKIKAVSLDSICDAYNFEKLLIKIDVEGAEAEVLEGMKNCIEKYQPKILLATHECHVVGVEQKCLTILKGYGYDCSPIDEHKFIDGQNDYWCEIN